MTLFQYKNYEFKIKFINPFNYIVWPSYEVPQWYLLFYWFLFWYREDICGVWVEYRLRILGVQFGFNKWLTGKYGG